MGNSDPLKPKQSRDTLPEPPPNSIKNGKSRRSISAFNDIDAINSLIKEARASITFRNKFLEEIYSHQQINSIVKTTLRKAGCPKQDNQDYFNEAIICFLKACYNPHFQIRTSLANYLAGIAKNLWYKEVTKRRDSSSIFLNNLVNEDDIESVEVVLIEKEKSKLIKELLAYLDSTCRHVLTLWSLNKRMKEIASKLNYKSEGMARKKKHLCLRKLYQILDEHPAFVKQLRN